MGKISQVKEKFDLGSIFKSLFGNNLSELSTPKGLEGVLTNSGLSTNEKTILKKALKNIENIETPISAPNGLKNPNKMLKQTGTLAQKETLNKEKGFERE